MRSEDKRLLESDLIFRDDETQLERIALITAYSLRKRPTLQSDIVARRVLNALPKTLQHFRVSPEASTVFITPDLRYIVSSGGGLFASQTPNLHGRLPVPRSVVSQSPSNLQVEGYSRR